MILLFPKGKIVYNKDMDNNFITRGKLIMIRAIYGKKRLR